MAKRTFIVDRSKWRCGMDGRFSKGTSNTTLRNSEGMMCCLGHTLHQCGIPMNVLTGKSMPNALGSVGFLGRASMFVKKVKSAGGKFIKGSGTLDDTPLSSVAATINDKEGLPIARRERILRKWFNMNGYGISFIGKSVPNPNAKNYDTNDAKKLRNMTDAEIIEQAQRDNDVLV